MEWSKYQKNVFESVVQLSDDVRGLADFVQNDFERLLEDGDITIEQIVNGLADLDAAVARTLVRITTARNDIKYLVEYYKNK